MLFYQPVMILYNLLYCKIVLSDNFKMYFITSSLTDFTEVRDII